MFIAHLKNSARPSERITLFGSGSAWLMCGHSILTRINHNFLICKIKITLFLLLSGDHMKECMLMASKLYLIVPRVPWNSLEGSFGETGERCGHHPSLHPQDPSSSTRFSDTAELSKVWYEAHCFFGLLIYFTLNPLMVLRFLYLKWWKNRD